MTALPRPPRGGLPAGARVVLDGRTSTWGGRLLMGGSPWRVLRLGDAARDLVSRLRSAGDLGVPLDSPTDRAAADALVERGFAHPVPDPRPPERVAVVVPAYSRPDALAACLDAVVRDGPTEVVVVDDASPDGEAMRAVAEQRGAKLIRHPVNQGPGAGRNTGLQATTAHLVAFVDSDCTPEPGWLDALLPLFDDPRVGAVAPRVRPRVPTGRPSLLARFEDARSALDMGRRRVLVRPGAPLGFVPSATLLVRRAALGAEGSNAFDPALRLGEDVDLVWRLAEAGWHVRYEPSVTVLHDGRLRPVEWARRRFDYGTSAADLDVRHPGRLAPARPSAWNLASGALLIARRPLSALAVGGVATVLLGRRLRESDGGPGLAALVVGKGLVADGAALGHALRREWWPLGWVALGVARRSRVARVAAVGMLAPVALEWVRDRPDVDPARYALLRLLEDAAYGSGVIASAVRGRRVRALLPVVRLPGLRGQGSSTNRS